MKILRQLLLPLALLAFAGCDRTVSSGAYSETEKTGALDFTLPAALRAQVAISADSLRVEMRQGTLLKSRSVALDSAVRMDGLDAGAWKISVGLYKAGGALSYFGEDSVRILPGQIAKAVVTLRPAKGSVDIVIRLEDPPQKPTALLGDWFLWQVDTFRVAGKSIPLRLDDSGKVTGTDGCNGIGGHYTATATSIRFGNDFFSTEMYCPIYQTMPGVTNALLKARFWKASNGELVLFDSLETVILRYGRTPPPVVPPVSPTKTIDSIGADTTGLALVAIRLDTAVASDSGVLLSVTLPYPGLDIRLFTLASHRTIGVSLPIEGGTPRTPQILVDTLPHDIPPRILVAGWIPKVGVPAIQVLTPAKVFVPWNVVGAYAAFEDHSGRTFSLLRPGYGLL